MKISVVIPAYNEERNMKTCLEALRRQTLPADEFEVIVVDNGSTDNTRRILMDFASGNGLKVMVITLLERMSIAAARNRAVAKSSGETLAFLDADCVPGPDWLSLGVERSAPKAVWGAHYAIPRDSTWIGSVWEQYQATAREGTVGFLPGGDMFLSRKDFDAIGGFDELLQTSEDVEFCRRARESGWNIRAMPVLAVVHNGTPQTLGHFYRKNRWHGRDVLRNFMAALPSLQNVGIVGLSVWTFFFFWVLLFSAVAMKWFETALFLLALLFPPMVLAIYKARSRLLDSPRLFVLYMVYSLARAASLLQTRWVR